MNKKNEILLFRGRKWKNIYTMPGGHVEIGETLEQALKREIKEETGLEIYDIRFLCFQEFIFGKEFHKKRHFIFFDYCCRARLGRIVLNSEHSNYIWTSLSRALRLPLDPYTRKAIQIVRKQVQ